MMFMSLSADFSCLVIVLPVAVRPLKSRITYFFLSGDVQRESEVSGEAAFVPSVAVRRYSARALTVENTGTLRQPVPFCRYQS